MKHWGVSAVLAACMAFTGANWVRAAGYPLDENRSPGSSCELMVKRAGAFAFVELPNFDPSVLSVPLVSPNPTENASAVICHRSTIVPLPDDYRVLVEMHLPLALQAGQTTIWLMMVSGQLEVQFKEGQATPDEMQILQARLDQMQTAILSNQR